MRSPLLWLVLLLPVPSLATSAALHWWPGTATGQTLFAIGKIWILVLPLAWYLLVGRRTPRAPTRPGGWTLAWVSGVVIGLAITATMLLTEGLLFHRSLIAEQLERAGLADPGIFLAGALYWCLVNSLLEEYVWRWFAVGRLGELLPMPAAVAAGGIAFALHHVIALLAYVPWGTALVAGLGVAIGGCWWSWLTIRHGRIWPAWVSHIIVDVAVFATTWQLATG